MSRKNPIIVEAQMLIRKPVAEVFEAFVNPQITTRFWFTKSSGRLEQGKTVRWDWEMFGVGDHLIVKELEVNKRILIEWESDNSTVEWQFEQQINDETLVRITNRDFPDNFEEALPAAVDAKGGYTMVLAGAKAWLEHGIELNLVRDQFPGLGVDEDELRTAKECAIRCVVLYGVVAAANGDNKKRIVRWLKEQNLWDATSPEEKNFLTTKKPERSQMVNSTWRVEALYVLLWALGKVRSAETLSETCDVSEVQGVCRFYLKNADEFIDSAHLRDQDEVEKLYEQIYQAHWEIRDAEIRNEPSPVTYVSGVVIERHYALNWLSGYLGQDWDDITTDT